MQLIDKLAAMGAARFFGELRQSGSHLRSLELVAAGEIALHRRWPRKCCAYRPRLIPSLGRRLPVLESWGPYRIQPVVARAGLPRPGPASGSPQALELGPRELGVFGVERFVPVGEALYASSPARERAA